MIEHQENMFVDDEFLPVCPHCGKQLTTNLRCDDKFVEDEGWHKAAERYNNFIRTRANQKTLFLELGVGYNTPSIIKYPFWQLTAKNSKATYACINFGEATCPKEIEHQSICINDDINNVILQLLK
jgi:NAD-dependent SIR2 family protein deacetylase